jgi:PKD repeat protein
VRLVGGNPSNPTPQKSPAPKSVPHVTLKARISAYPQTTIAPGQSIDFTSLDSSGNVVKSNWDLDGNGHFDTTGEDVSHRYDKPGRYTVKLKVTDAGKHTSTATTTVTVNANRAPVAAIHLPTDATVNQSVTATAAGSSDPDGHIVRYDWDMNGDGDFGQDGASHSYTYTQPGDYVATLKVTDNDGNSAIAHATIHVHDYAGPQSRLSCNASDVASGTTVACHADDSGSPTRIVKHEWDMNDDGSYSTGGTDSSFKYATPGNYTVHMRVTDSRGKQSVSTVDLRVEDRAPVATITLPAKIVAGQTATLDGSHSSDPDGSVAAWEWDLDNDGVFEHSGSPVSAVFGSWGTRTIALRVIDDWGVATTTTAQIRVLAPPVAAGVVTTASPAVNANVSFLPTGSSDPDGTIVKYQWDFNDDGATDKTTTSAGTVATWKWTAAGSYQVKLTVTDNDGVKTSVLIPVTVH